MNVLGVEFVIDSQKYHLVQGSNLFLPSVTVMSAGTICQLMDGIKMIELKETIARYMWLYLKENSPESAKELCQEDVFHMADIAVQLTIKEIDAMLLEQIKTKLEKLITND